jgi:hypothetical protein
VIRYRIAGLLLLLGIAATAAAQVAPVVRIEATPDQVRVGEPVRLRVTVLVPTWFPKPPLFPDVELANTVTRLPPNSSYPTSERIDGETWSGIVRNYRIYPLAAADYSLRGLAMTVTYANPGSEPSVAEVDLPAVTFRGVVPDGARTLDPYLAGSALTLARDIDGDTEGLKVGDALVVRYTAELDGLPAMFLPPMIQPPQVPGVSAYLKEPAVSDAQTARRTEQVTLVFDAGGTFELPGVSLDWWNTAEERIETVSVPALTLTVAGPPPQATAPPSAPPDLKRLLAVVVAGLAAVGLLMRVGPTALRWFRERAEQQRQTEGHAFGEFTKAAASGDAGATYQALLTWLERIGTGLDARRFARHFGDERLAADCDALSRDLFTDGGSVPDLRQFAASFAQARRRYLASVSRPASGGLPNLNP